jgi:hypothetical protein
MHVCVHISVHIYACGRGLILIQEKLPVEYAHMCRKNISASHDRSEECHLITSSALKTIVLGLSGTIVPKARYYMYNILRYMVAFLFTITSYPVRIRVRIDPPHPLVCCKRRLNGWSFGWDRKNRGLVSHKVWHGKDPSLLKGPERRA